MAPRSGRHIPRDNERTRLKTEQAIRTETRRLEGGGIEESWMLERDRLLAIIRDRKDDLLKIRQAKQAEKERLEKEELEKQRLEKKQLEKKRKEQKRLDILSARANVLSRSVVPPVLQLSRWQRWVRRYRENLSAEGFTLSDGLWRRPINSDDMKNTVTFKDAKAEKLSDIPIEFPCGLWESAYIYVSWDRIRYEHIWYSEREENLLDLGFHKKIVWGSICLRWPKWRGFSSFQMPDFEGTVWDWPGADDKESLYHIHPPEDFSPYQILDLAGFDKSLLDGVQEQRYRRDPNRLPSAQLGRPRDPVLHFWRPLARMKNYRLEKSIQFTEVGIPHRIEKPRWTFLKRPRFVQLWAYFSPEKRCKPWSRADMKLWWIDEASRTSKCIEMLVHVLVLT